MNKIENFDIAIIGGGMVGASLALLLAEQKPNWQIALLEAQPFVAADQTQFQPSFDARSTAIAQGSVEILRELGVWENLAKHATAISQVHVSDAGHFMGGLIDASTYDLDAVGYVVPNAWIGRVLLAQLRTKTNIHLFAPVRVEKLIPQQAGAQLIVKSGDEVFELTTKGKLKADLEERNKEIAQLNEHVDQLRNENQNLITTVGLQEAELTDKEAQILAKQQELALIEAKIQELMISSKVSEADGYYARAQAVEEAANRTKLAPKKKKETYTEAIELYKKALSLGKEEAQAKITELEKKI